MAGRPLAAALQTCDAALDDAIEDELLTTLPRESDSTRIREPVSTFHEVFRALLNKSLNLSKRCLVPAY